VKRSLQILLIAVVLSAALLVHARPSIIVSAKFLRSVEGSVVGFETLQSPSFYVLLTPRELLTLGAGAEKPISHYRFGTMERAFRLDRMDIDGDGRDELAVTVVSSERPASYLFKIDDEGGLTSIVSGIPFYLRAVVTPSGRELVGQQSISEDAFVGGVYRLTLKGGRLKKNGRLDLPKKTGIYQFAAPLTDSEAVWIRGSSDRLRRYEKLRGKWKQVYKSSERYRSETNCFVFKKYDVMSEDRKVAVCVPVPPEFVSISQIAKGGEAKGLELLLLDRSNFALGGVILEPKVPSKSFLDVMNYTDLAGLVQCRQYGPMQGWIGDLTVIRAPVAPGKEKSPKVLVFINGNEFSKATSRVEEFDMSSIDCQGEM